MKKRETWFWFAWRWKGIMLKLKSLIFLLVRIFYVSRLWFYIQKKF